MSDLNLEKQKEKLRGLYTAPKKHLNALILGEKGAGKTSLLLTCPKPLYLFSFDPGGAVVLNDQIESGDIIADTRYEFEDASKPTAAKLFETEFDRFLREGTHELFATVAIDGATNLADAIIHQIMAKEGRIPPGLSGKTDESRHGMRIQDWGTLARVFHRLCHNMSAMPCHTILFGHLARERDEVRQTYVRSFLCPGSSANKIPATIPDLLVLEKSTKGGSLTRTLLTQDKGEYRASVRTTGLSAEEPPDIRALLKKANYEHTDKEPLNL